MEGNKMTEHTEKQKPGGPLRAYRHFQGNFGMWFAGGTGDPCEPYFFEMGTLNKIKASARQAGYTSIIAANKVSHRTTKTREITL